MDEKYTVAFIFDATLEHILLVHKQKPSWQKGRVNGIGGKYEHGETGPQCVARETKEETNLEIPEEAWIHVGTIKQQVGNVGVFTTRYTGERGGAKAMDHEDIEWFPVDALPKNIMDNLHFLVPLSLEKIRTDEFESFTLVNK